MTYVLYCPHHLVIQKSQNSKATVRILDVDPRRNGFLFPALPFLAHMAMYEVQQSSSSKPVIHVLPLLRAKVQHPLHSNIKPGQMNTRWHRKRTFEDILPHLTLTRSPGLSHVKVK
jgi:hypothetical protein